MFSTALILLVWLPLGALVGLIGIPLTLLTGDISWMYWNALRVVRMGLRAGGIRVMVSGLEHVPPGQACIFLANHVSNLDPPVLIPVLPGRCVVLLKKSLMGIPILGRAMRMAGFIPVERGAQRESAQRSVAAAKEALRAGRHILIFPEGTRSLDGRLAPFKKGPFFLALEAGALVIPVAISGTEGMMRKGSSRVTPGVARVRMLAPIDPQGFASREQLMAGVHAAIAAALPESMRSLG